MTHKVFVYGTLKRKEPNYHWLTNKENGKAEFLCEATTSKKYPLIIGTKYNIPFLLHKPGVGHHVKGEVWEVDNAMLEKLDELEGHPEYYEREVETFVPTTRIKDEDVKEVQCWVYFIKTFRESLLNDPLLENYSSKGPHGRVYADRSARTPYNWIADIRK